MRLPHGSRQEGDFYSVNESPSESHSPPSVEHDLDSGTRKLRILFVVLNFSPEPTGTGKFTGEFARHLRDLGHEVQVISTPPYYPWWKVPKPYAMNRFQIEDLSGIQIMRCPVYVPARPTGLRRILHLLSAGVSFLPASFWTRGPIDLVFNVQPTLTTSLTAAFVAGLHRSPLWLHVQDLEVSAAQQLGMIPFGLKWISSRVERIIYSKCEGISTITDAMANQLQRHGARTRPAVFPNWVDTELIKPQKGSGYRQELGISESTVVALYSGNMGEKQGLEIILQSAKRLAGQDIQFVLAGNGASRERLEAEAAGMANVRFLPLQPAERMSDFLALGDIHLVPQKAGFGDCVMPSKMTAILSAGRPCVATAQPDDELATIADQCGFSVLPGDSAGFANGIYLLAKDTELRNQLGRAARAFALEHLSSHSILGRMEQFALQIAGGSSSRVEE